MAAAGFEVLFASVQSQLKGDSDAIVCCVHWNLVTNGFKCIGVGETAPADIASIRKSELLPAGWSDSQDVYCLLYCLGETDMHALKIIRMDSILLIHVMRLRDEKVASMQITISDYTTGDLSSFDSAFRNLDNLQQNFKKEIINELKEVPAKVTTQPRDSPLRADRSLEDDPLRVPPRHGRGHYAPEWGEPDDPFSVGRGDLDPLAGGRGGGMMFDPMRSGFPGVHPDPDAGLPGRLPRGAVPPGARFDPFGPPDPGAGMNPRGGRRPGPDPDHLPPPGYDDMFM